MSSVRPDVGLELHGPEIKTQAETESQTLK